LRFPCQIRVAKIISDIFEEVVNDAEGCCKRYLSEIGCAGIDQGDDADEQRESDHLGQRPGPQFQRCDRLRVQIEMEGDTYWTLICWERTARKSNCFAEGRGGSIYANGAQHFIFSEMKKTGAQAVQERLSVFVGNFNS
jgi:hypothetical protein